LKWRAAAGGSKGFASVLEYTEPLFMRYSTLERFVKNASIFFI